MCLLCSCGKLSSQTDRQDKMLQSISSSCRQVLHLMNVLSCRVWIASSIAGFVKMSVACM